MRTSAKHRHLLDGAQPNLELCSILLNLLLLLSALDPQKTFWQSCILDLGSGSKISALDPRRCFEHLGSWMLDPYNVRLEIFKSEPFSDLRFSSRRNRSKTKKQSMNFRQKHCLKKIVFVFCGFIDVLLQCIQDSQKTFLGSGPKIQDPRLSKNFSWIQGRNLGSKWDCWIQGFPTQVFQNLGSWIRAPWDPKSDSCSDLRSQVWGPTCYLKI